MLAKHGFWHPYGVDAERELSRVPESSGVYIAYFERIPLYVGSSVNLRARLSQHMQCGLFTLFGCSASDAVHKIDRVFHGLLPRGIVQYVLSANHVESEREVISRIRPLCNRGAAAKLWDIPGTLPLRGVDWLNLDGRRDGSRKVARQLKWAANALRRRALVGS